MAYVDGFVLPVPRKNLPAYRRMAQKAGRIWQEYGALEFRECVGDDLDVKRGRSFPRQLKLKRGETVVFSWIVYRSRPPRPGQREGDERPADRHGHEGHALRHEAHGLRRLQDAGGSRACEAPRTSSHAAQRASRSGTATPR